MFGHLWEVEFTLRFQQPDIVPITVFATGAFDNMSTTPAANLPMVSLTPGQICCRYQQH
jgi:hypothetical protein